MHTKAMAILAALVTMGAAAAIAEAQTAPTCSFNAGTATVTVTVNGEEARVRTDGATGAIQLNTVGCGGATVSNTDRIQVNGGTFHDDVSLSGSFAPGLTPEADGVSEIEIVAALAGNSNHAQVKLTSGDDHLVFVAGGLDVGADGDADITVASSVDFEVYGRGGNDTLDAREFADRVGLYGGAGDDRLFGGAGGDSLHGDEGSDTIFAGAGGDWLYSGPGDDVFYGGPGDDFFAGEVNLDGSDAMYGGEGIDSVHYNPRLAHITVILNNGVADDGEAGENDLVEGMENVTGGKGGNLLVGTDGPNRFVGGRGADEIYGGGGDDSIQGFAGQDILVGDAGNDFLSGGPAPDSIDGGGGADEIYGGDANDTLTGGAGHDDLFGGEGDDTIYNAGDNMLDRVDCGDGPADDAEPDPLDTYTGCEL